MALFRNSVLTLLVILILAACGSKPTLEGNWNGSIDFQGLAVELEYRFSPDGELELRQSANKKVSTQKGKYAWKEGEKTFTFTPVSLQAEGDPALIRMVNEEMAKNPKTYTFELTWIDSSTINVKQQGAMAPLDSVITLRRK